MRSTSVCFPIGITALAAIATLLLLDDATAFAPPGFRGNFLPVCHNVGLKSTVAPIPEPSVDGENETISPAEKNGKVANSMPKKKKKATPKGTKSATSNMSASPSSKNGRTTQKGSKVSSAKKSTSSPRKGKNGRSSPKGKKAPKGKKSPKANAARQFRPLKDLQLGSTISGTVIDVCDFGAFISTEYATRGSHFGAALLHISQIADKRVENIHDVLVKGQKIENARVINVDIAKGEVGLSMRARRQKRRDTSSIQVGDELVGRVKQIVEYGAFIDVGATSNPLLHVSRITGSSIDNIRHHLNEGDPVSVHVIDVNKEKKTIAVSMLDRKADQYLDRRLSQRMKKLYGSAKKSTPKMKEVVVGANSEVDYFDNAIRELEDALTGRDLHAL